jgi:hypothetical protein
VLPFERDSIAMRRSVNRLLLATLLCLYGVVTLSGPALHSLPGLSHAAAKLAGRDEASPGHGERENNAAHDCPICHFHAQGQLIDDPDDGPCIDVVRVRPADESPLFHPPALHRSSSPRAPPLA